MDTPLLLTRLHPCAQAPFDGIEHIIFRGLVESFDGAPSWLYFAIPACAPGAGYAYAALEKFVPLLADPRTVSWRPIAR